MGNTAAQLELGIGALQAFLSSNDEKTIVNDKKTTAIHINILKIYSKYKIRDKMALLENSGQARDAQAD